MDSGETDKFEGEKRNEDPSSFHSDWRFGGANLTNTSMGLIHMGNPIALRKGDLIGSSTSCASSSIVDSYCPVPWDHHTNPQSLSPLTFRKGVPGSMGAPTDNFGWNPPPSSTMKGGVFLPNMSGILPQSLSQFPADSAFIERAARFSCFNGGNFSDMVNQLSCREPMNPYSTSSGIVQGSQEVFTNDPLKMVPGKNVSLSVEHGATEGSPLKNERKSEGFARTHDEAKEGAGVSCNESDEAGFSGSGGQEETFMLDEKVGEPSAKGIGLKKRKRSGQDVELNRVKGALPQINDAAKGNTEIQQKGGENPTSISNKSVGKQSKHGTQASEPSKEEYIHVRARRGQATNSHSLAERVRREKISERMKYLQDLVPGCSKVTGKAVMLDEIINYVQSLQRQVEFLSMKLATVNPRLDLNIEGLLAKDILQSRAGPSSALGFSSDMAVTYAQPHPSQPGLTLSGFSNMKNPSDALRRTMTSKLTAMNGGFREPTQLSNVWEDELHNVVQMSFDTTAPSNSQDINASPPPPGHAKVKL